MKNEKINIKIMKDWETAFLFYLEKSLLLLINFNSNTLIAITFTISLLKNYHLWNKICKYKNYD